MKMMNYL